MGGSTKIEWTATVMPDGRVVPGHSFNPWVGCLKVSPGCDHCYAEDWAKRSGLVKWGEARRRTSIANWDKPIRWDKEAKAEGVRRRVFCASLADVFDNEVPQAWREDLWDLIERTPNLDWLLLTKRVGNVKGMVPDYWEHCWPRNIWLGASIVNQAEADRDIVKLLATPARIRFLSVEPMLERIDMRLDWRKLDWVICGGESGHHARPMEAEWAISLMYQCMAQGCAFFMKQGSQANWPTFKDFASFPDHLRVREWPCLT